MREVTVEAVAASAITISDLTSTDIWSTRRPRSLTVGAVAEVIRGNICCESSTRSRERKNRADGRAATIGNRIRSATIGQSREPAASRRRDVRPRLLQPTAKATTDRLSTRFPGSRRRSARRNSTTAATTTAGMPPVRRPSTFRASIRRCRRPRPRDRRSSGTPTAAAAFNSNRPNRWCAGTGPVT